MGLITCPECGRKNVSEYADACPGCGFNIRRSFSKGNEKKNFISLGNITIKINDITSFEYKNASHDFLYPIEKLESIISLKEEVALQLRGKADAAWRNALRTQSFGYADESQAANLAANDIDSEIVYYKNKYENLINRINHFSEKYELAKANNLFVLNIKTVYKNYKYYNATAPFDIKMKYKELVESIN